MRRLQQPTLIKAAVGTTKVAEAGTRQVGDIEIPKLITRHDSPDSVVAMQDMALQGYTLVQRLEAAALVKGEHMIELVPSEGCIFRLSVSTAKKAVDIEVQRKVTMLHQQAS